MARRRGSPHRTIGQPALDIVQASVEGDAVGGPSSPRTYSSQIAQSLQVSTTAVNQLLERQAPVLHTLRTLQRDHFLSGWQYFYLRALAEVQDTWPAMKWSERRDAAVIMGIATERALLVSGQPTAIIAGVHEHRHELPQLAALLTNVARRLKAPTVIEAGAIPSPRGAVAFSGVVDSTSVAFPAGSSDLKSSSVPPAVVGVSPDA